MRRIQSTSLLGALLVVALPLACSQEPTEPTEQQREATEVAPAAEAPPEASAEAPPMKRAQRRPSAGGGPSEALLHAASKLELTEAQRTQIAALQQLRPESKPDVDHQAFQTTLAEGVRAGRVDEKLIQDHLNKGKEAAESFRATQLKQLNELHALLDPSQRALLVKEAKAGLEEQRSQRSAMLDRVRPGMAKGLKGDEGSEDEGPKGVKDLKGPRGAKQGKGAMGHLGMKRGLRGMDPLAALTRGLELTEAQQEQIDAISEKLQAKEPKGEVEGSPIDRQQQLLDAFVKDDFDATKLELSHHAPRAESHLQHLNEVLAVLTADQREALATRLTRGADRARGFARGPRGGKGMMKRGLKRPGGEQPGAEKPAPEQPAQE